MSELIEQLAKEKAQEFKFSELGCELHASINCGDISANALMDIVYRTAYTEAYQAAAPIDNVAEADAKKLWKALNDLSFDCFAGLGVRTPTLKVYNETFKVMDSYRSTYGALIPDTQANAQPTQGQSKPKNTFCTVHNADKSKCQLHNLQCAYPSCISAAPIESERE
jgi:hypothetical protein